MATRKKKKKEVENNEQPHESAEAMIETAHEPKEAPRLADNVMLEGYLRGLRDALHKYNELYARTSMPAFAAAWLAWMNGQIDPPSADDTSKAEGDAA